MSGSMVLMMIMMMRRMKMVPCCVSMLLITCGNSQTVGVQGRWILPQTEHLSMWPTVVAHPCREPQFRAEVTPAVSGSSSCVQTLALHQSLQLMQLSRFSLVRLNLMLFHSHAVTMNHIDFQLFQVFSLWNFGRLLHHFFSVATSVLQQSDA